MVHEDRRAVAAAAFRLAEVVGIPAVNHDVELRAHDDFEDCERSQDESTDKHSDAEDAHCVQFPEVEATHEVREAPFQEHLQKNRHAVPGTETVRDRGKERGDAPADHRDIDPGELEGLEDFGVFEIDTEERSQAEGTDFRIIREDGDDDFGLREEAPSDDKDSGDGDFRRVIIEEPERERDEPKHRNIGKEVHRKPPWLKGKRESEGGGVNFFRGRSASEEP